MYKVDDTDAAASMPAPTASANPGWFQEGNPGTGTPATVIRADWLNGVTAELLSILTAAGIAPVKNVFNQVLTAILTLIQAGAGVAQDDTGTAAAYVITPSPAVTAYARYQTFTFKAANANTGAATINVNGLGAKAIVRPDGGALQAGDIVAGQVVVVRYDGTSFQVANPLTVKDAGANNSSTKPASTSWVQTNFATLAATASLVTSAAMATFVAAQGFATIAGFQGLVSGCIAAVATAAGFVISPGTVGYVKFPSWLGGFVIQWQSGSVTAPTTIAWPIAFPTSCVGAVAIPNSASTTTYGINVASNTTTGGQFWPNSAGGGVTIFMTVISIGY